MKHKIQIVDNFLDIPLEYKNSNNLQPTQEISNKIAELLTPTSIKAKVEIVYQTVENLHKACPKNLGDWYFSGNYPTPGGNKVVNKSFINYMEGKNVRAY